MPSGIVTVDLIGFLLLVLVTATGGIIKWYLPPGSGHGGHGGHGHGPGGGLGHGPGHGPGHGQDLMGGEDAGPKLLWGMDRHEWGDIHFWLSVAFLVVMAVHLYQHRYWLRACLSRGATCAAGENA